MDVDLNGDLGEGSGNDAALLTLLTSANVCCGVHAGDALTSLATLRLAQTLGVAVGAHPGHADREHFGRRELTKSSEEVFAECVWQIGALAGLAKAAGIRLGHLKPHGALYHQSARDDAYARPIVDAAVACGLTLVGLPSSRLEACAAGRCPFVAEGFADRRYRADGTLVPRDQPDAFVHDPTEAIKQVEWLLGQGVRTICIHGDNPDALDFARSVRTALEAAGHRCRSFGGPVM